MVSRSFRAPTLISRTRLQRISTLHGIGATSISSQLPILTREGFFGINDRGGFSAAMADPSVPLEAGYGIVLGDAPVFNPQGLAIFSFRQDDIVISEATVPATTAIQRGILYAEVNGPVRTGIAISNPGDQPATISFSYTDTDGKVSGQGSTVISAHGQITRFLDQAPFSSGTFTRGTFTFEASSSVFAIALRGVTNERSQFIISTLPVIDLSAPPTGSIIPHFADGGGWTTQTILVNPTSQVIRGTLEFRPNSGDVTTTPYTTSTAELFRSQNFEHVHTRSAVDPFVYSPAPTLPLRPSSYFRFVATA